MNKHYVLLIFILTFSLSINAKTSNEVDYSTVIDTMVAPDQIADSIVIYVPNKDMSLHRPATTERTIMGKSIWVEKGLEPNVIIHKSHTIILPIEAGVPVRLFLKQFPDRDAYYPIAIYPIFSGAKP